jgi:hypothetical protein
MGKQQEIPVPKAPVADIDRLRAALAFYGHHEDPKRLARKVDDGRWEFEVAVVGMPPVRAVGHTRDECLRDALRSATEALRVHAVDLRQRIEILTDKAGDIERFVAESAPGRG